MNLHIFPTKFVYWKQVENHENIKKEYYDRVLNDLNQNKIKYKREVEMNWNCDCYSSFFENKILERGVIDQKFLEKVIWDNFDQMLLELNRSILKIPFPKKSNIPNIWSNYYSEGMFQEVHNHNNNNCKCNFSGIYLMHLEENNTTTFIDDTSYSIYPNSDNLQTFKTNHIKEGNIIFFPSNLMHYVNPCMRNRITISFNILSEY
jgi:hypothetical protein